MTDGLKDKHRKAIIEILSAGERVERVVLFGSRAMGTFTATSDVDIALFGDELTLTDHAKFAEAVDELSVPQQVDILLHKSIKNKKLLKHIKRHGVEWYRRSLDMRSEWQSAKFDSLFLIPLRNGLTRPKAVRGSGTKMVNMGEIFAYDRIADPPMERVPLSDKEVRNYTLEKGDLLFARASLKLSGAGKCSITMDSQELRTFESHLIRARLDPSKAAPGFYYYFFRSPLGRNVIFSIVEQVSAAGIRGSDLAKLQVPVPPLADQRAIAHILGTLDDKIELNRRMNQTLEAMAKAIFKSWFVDFDPVRAKAEGRIPPGLDAGTAALFPDSFEDSELGPIPKGWTVHSLDEIAEFLNGLACQKYPPDGDKSLPVVKIRELRQGITSNSDRASVEVPTKYNIHDGDMLLSWSGSLLATLWCHGPGVLNQHVFKVSSDAFPKWLYYLWTLYHLEAFQRIAADKATTMGHIQRHHLAEAMVVVPQGDTLQAMDRILAPLIERQIANNIETHTLAATRDALLPKLLSGEIRVPEAEKMVEEAG